MKQFTKPLIVLLILAVSCGAAMAKFASPGDAITYRKAVMQVIKKHFGSMAGVVKGKTPYDKGAFAKDAAILATMSKLPWEASMVPGSAAGDTTLKASALKDADGYMAAAKKFEDAALKLAGAADGGDMGTIKARFGATAQTCKGCHGKYRK
jgi:cytochrome c556